MKKIEDKPRSVKALLFASLFLLLPLITLAAGLVPCDGYNTVCQACHLIQLGNNILKWLVIVMASIGALVIMMAGLKMVTAGGNAGKISAAKKTIGNIILGYILLLAAWLIIDTIMKQFVDGAKVGVWNQIECVAQPEYISWNPLPDQSRGVSPSSPTQSTLPQAVAAVGAYKDQLCGIAKNAGLENECASLQAIMTQESGGNPNAKSNVGALGLMQVTPGAARSLDPLLKGLSDEEVKKKLLDPSYNMQIAVAYYKDSAAKYGATNYDTIYAAYNGGAGAVKPSSDCPGLQRWQCVWDSPGCYNTGRTDCVPNTGYKETRDYVTKVNNYRKTYGG